MADAIVGTWKGHASASTGVKDLHDIVGGGAVLGDYSKSYTMVVTKEGSNKYIIKTSAEGEPIDTEVIVIGQKHKQVWPGLPETEIEYREEGGKICGRCELNGVEMNGCRYVEGNTMILEMNFGGVTATWKSTRA